MFHAPMDAAMPENAPDGLGYVSNDGHQFSCKNPIVMQQAYHVCVSHPTSLLYILNAVP